MRWLMIFFILWSASCHAAENRIALVIGNSAYEHTRTLANPKNDAKAVADTLKSIGFDKVTLKIDLNYQDMRTAVREFGETVTDVDVALIYFAGHGLETNGENYVLPVDAKLAKRRDLDYETLNLNSLLQAVEGARKLRLVVLDACRNNPLGEKMQIEGGTRSVARGLARVEPVGNVLIAYSAKHGTVARDGAGDLSPFAAALVKRLPTPGLELNLVFRHVRDDVLQATGREQEPFIYGSLGGSPIYFVPIIVNAPNGDANITINAPSFEQQAELAFWNSVKDSRNIAIIQTYLDRFPNGAFSGLAKAFIEDIRLRNARQAANPPGADSVAQSAWTPWLNQSGYQTEFNLQNGAKRYPVEVEARTENGTVEYRGRFASYPPGRFGFQTRHSISDEDFRASEELFRREGYRLIHHQSVTLGDRAYNQATWVKP